MPAVDWHLYNAGLMIVNAIIATLWAAASFRLARDPAATIWIGPLGRWQAVEPPADWRWTVVSWMSAKAMFFWVIALAILIVLPQPIGEAGLTIFTAIHGYAFWRWLLLPPSAPAS